MPTFHNDPVLSDSNSTNTSAIRGESTGNEGVRGVSHNAHGGVVGINDSAAGGNGGYFESTQGEGVRGVSHNPHGGVSRYQ
jgi:hypothetical protein